MGRVFQLRMALVVLVATLVYFGLTPFSFHPPNRVKWTTAEQGLAFEGRGLIYSENPLNWDGPYETALSIHLLVESQQDASRGLGALLSFDDGESQAPLLIAQWRDGLIMRTRQHEDPRGRGYWEIGTREALGAFERRLVSIVSDSEHGTKIFIDGELRREDARSIIDAGRGFGGRLVLGSLRDGSAGWSGTLRGLSVYRESLSAFEVAADAARIFEQGFPALARRHGELAFYVFDGRDADLAADRSIPSRAGPLVIPSVFTPLAPAIFELPERGVFRRGWFFRDGLRNLLGFIPLGFLVVLLCVIEGGPSGVKSVGLALLVGGCLSLGIEAIQVLLPMRNSSLLDLGLNFSGTGLGALLALWLARVLPKYKMRIGR